MFSNNNKIKIKQSDSGDLSMNYLPLKHEKSELSNPNIK